MERYEFLLAEREMVADLTDNFRTCCFCDTWASSQESVRCEYVDGLTAPCTEN